MSSATRFPSGVNAGPTMLANDDVEQNIELVLPIQAAVTGGIKCAVKLQGTGTYTILAGDATWNTAGGAPVAGHQFNVLAGTNSGAGFVTVTTIVAATTWFGVGFASNDIALTLNATTVTAPTIVVLNISALGATPPTSGHLSITLRCTRSLV